MKKNGMKLFLLLTVVVLGLSSCGSSKKVADPNPGVKEPGRVKLEKEECEEMAMDAKEFLRGYGIGVSADKTFARDIASTNARNELVNQVQSSVANTLERYNQQHQVSGKEGLTREEVQRVKGMVKSMAEETLTGARVICSNTYMKGNDYEVHVCIELTGENFVSKVAQKISSDEKLKIDFEAERFKDEFNKDLEEYRKRKQ